MAPFIAQIHSAEDALRGLSEEALIGKTQEFRERLAKGETIDQLLPEAFAVVKNACRRFTESRRVIKVRGHELVWEMVPFDVQLVGGIVLHTGRIAEMGTGEGKTLVATLPTYLNALEGKGVHVVTVNDYLAARDSEWVGEIYRYLGLTVGCIQHDMSPAQRREAYACDVTYGTNTEFGFDYLRDNGMATRSEDQVQRGYHYAIVDEVDSILIDEARTPLIISGPATVAANLQFDRFKPAIEKLLREQTRLCNELAGSANKASAEGRTDEAASIFYRIKVGMPHHKMLMKAMEDPALRGAIEEYETNLYADTRREELYKVKDELYFAVDPRNSECDLSVMGREFMSPDDPDAFVVPDLITQLHDVNADTSLSPAQKDEKRAQIQQHFDEANERIHTIHQLLRAYCTLEKDVNYVVQDNKILIVDEFTGRALPGRRWSDGLHGAVEAKEGVHVDRETQTLATITIQNYFRLYKKLAGMTGTAETEANEFKDIYKLDVVVIPPNQICLRDDSNDAVYKTRREKYNAVVRDIQSRHALKQPMLIGTASVESSELLSRMLKREGIVHNVLNAKFHQQEAEIVARAGQPGAVTIATNMAGRGTDIKLAQGVSDIGGLCVIGTERHESRRIDRQLRGRCARQGDPGESKFYVSFEDELMRNFADSRKLAAWMTKLGMKDDEELQHPWLNKSVEGAQKRVEQRNYSIRRHTLQYDDVMNQQRMVVYEFRNEILHTSNPRQVVFDVVEEVLQDKSAQCFDSGRIDLAQAEEFCAWLTSAFPIQVALAEVESMADEAALTALLLQKVRDSYALKVQYEDPTASMSLERYMALSAIDRLWQEHLYAMDGLRTSIGLRAYGQRDPLVEYKQEAFQMFEVMMVTVKSEIAQNVFRSTSSLTAFEKFLSALPQKFVHEQLSGMGGEMQAPSQEQTSISPEQAAAAVDEAVAQAAAPVRREGPKLGRNDPCPIDPKKKFKNCCGATGARCCLKV